MANIEQPVQASRDTGRAAFRQAPPAGASRVILGLLCVWLTSLALSAQEPGAGDPRQFDVLAGKLAGTDATAQREAVDALKQADAWAVWQALEKLPPSPSRDLTLLDALLRVLKDPEGDACRRVAAAMALPAMGNAALPARAELLRLVADRECPARVRGEAAESLAYLFPQDSSVVSALVGMVEERALPGSTSPGPAGIEAGVARAGARVLAGLGDRGEAALLEFLIAGAEPATGLAAWALREHGDPARSPLVEQVTWLLSGDVGPSPERLRRAVVNSLLGQGGARRSAINVIVSGLATGGPADRLLCIRTSGALGADGRGAVPGLIRMLDDQNAAFRPPVLASLGELGTVSASATPALEKILREAEGYQQVPPATALVRIDADHGVAAAVLASFLTSAEDDRTARQEVCGQIAQASARAALLAHGSPEAVRFATRLESASHLVNARLIRRLGRVLSALGSDALAELADACPVEGAGPAEIHGFIQTIEGLESSAPAAGNAQAQVEVTAGAALLERALARGAPSFTHLPVAVALLKADSGSTAAVMALLVPMVSGPGGADVLGWYAESELKAAGMATDAVATRPARTLQQLISALADPDAQERQLALGELGEMALAAAPAVPSIRAIIRHGGSAIAQRMIHVLETANPPAPEAVATILGMLTQQVSPSRMREILLEMPLDGAGLDSGTREQLTKIVDEHAVDPRTNHVWSKDLTSMVALPPLARATLAEVRPARSLSASQVVQGLEQGEIDPVEGLGALLASGTQGRALVPEVLQTLLDRRPAGAPAPVRAEPGSDDLEDEEVVLLLSLMQGEKQKSGDQVRLLSEACPVTLGALRLIGAPPSGALTRLEKLVKDRNPRAGGLALHAMAEIAPRDQRTTEALLALLNSTEPAEIGRALDVASSTTVAGSSPEVCQRIVDLVASGRLDEHSLYSAMLALGPCGPRAQGAAPRLFGTIRALACERPAPAGRRAERKPMLQACLRSIEGR